MFTRTAAGLTTVVLLLFALGKGAEGATAMQSEAALRSLSEIEAGVREGKTTEALKPLAGSLLKEILAAGTPLAEGDQLIFVFFGQAKSVEAHGGFGLETGEATATLTRLGDLGFWVGRARVLPDCEFLYRLKIDGQFKPDPLCKETQEGFGTNSVGRGSACKPLAELSFRPDIPHGVLESFEIESPGKPNTLRRISVYLPPGYPKRWRRYPVLYVHDGDAAITAGRFDRIADNLLAQGAIRPLIMVFVPPVNRALEYWITDKEYAEFLTNQVVPVIDQRYRTKAAARHRAVTGASLGGRISTYLVTNHPDVFGICIGQSSYFEKDCKVIQQLRDGPRLPVRFYYDVGVFERDVARGFGAEFARDLVAINRDLRDMLKQRGYEVAYREWTGGHCMLTWDRGMVAALRTLWPTQQ